MRKAETRSVCVSETHDTRTERGSPLDTIEWGSARVGPSFVSVADDAVTHQRAARSVRNDPVICRHRLRTIRQYPGVRPRHWFLAVRRKVGDKEIAEKYAIVNHRFSQLLRVRLAARITLRDVVRRAVLTHDIRMVD